jgi:MYXO-CTERM domain-containing protein
MRPPRRFASLLALGVLAAAPAVTAAPLFKDATGNLGSPQPCVDPQNPDAEGCYTHYVVMADLDGDGDLDLVFAGGGGYYTPGSTAPFLVYLNDGTGHFSYVNATVFGGWAGRVRQIAVGDVDGDGRPDIYVPQGYGKQADGIQDAFFINHGGDPPVFVDESATRLPITSRAGAVRFGDVDGDGALDLVITDWGDSPPSSPGTAHVYLNDGTGHFTEKVGAIPMDTSAQGTGPIDVDFVDVDGDFDLDLVFASRQGNSLLFLNDGSGNFTNVPLPGQPGPYVYGPDACDVDGDGDLDLWLDNGGAGHTTQLLINDGTGTFTDETAQRVSGNPPGADDNAVRCVDIDGDGDFDAVIASLSDNERILLNDGTGHFTLIQGAFPKVSDSTLGLDVGDVDGDHLLDVITAQGESGPFLNRLYLGIAPQLPDTRAPAFRSVEKLPDGTAPGVSRVRFAVTDSATTDIGPRLRQAYLEVNGNLTPARFVGGDLFLGVIAVPPGVTTTYRACAVDAAGNQGCSADVTFTAAGTAGTGGAGGTGGGGSSGSTSSSAGAGGTGGGGAGGGESRGCGCAVPGERGEGGLAALLGLAGVAAAARRRARRRV